MPYNSSKPSKSPHLQTQSPLFVLPSEIRLRIFKFVLSSDPIPLSVIGPRKELELVLSTPGIGGAAAQAWRAIRPLGLLLACARAHDEALPLLYANTFAIGDPRAVRLLERRAHARLIKRLDFSWTLSRAPAMKPKKRLGGLLGTEKDEWAGVWEAMKELKGLGWLQIELSVPYLWTPEWKEREGEILTPLEGVLPDGAKGELILSWPRTPRVTGAEELLERWTVHRRYED
jgi:hypothetical protein